MIQQEAFMQEMTTLESVQDALKISHQTTMLLFHAPWCSMCQMYTFVVRRFSDANPNVRILGIDISKYPEISDHFSILNTPTTMIFKAGEHIKTIVGPVSQRMLQSYIK